MKKTMIVLGIVFVAAGTLLGGPLNPFSTPPEQKSNHKRQVRVDTAAHVVADSAQQIDDPQPLEHPNRTGRLTLAEFFDTRHSERESDSAIKAATEAVIHAAFQKIRRLAIGKTTESAFRTQWYGAPSPDADWLNHVVGPIGSPRTLETAGRRSATYYIGRKTDDSGTDFWWAVTFVNGVLESIYTY